MKDFRNDLVAKFFPTQKERSANKFKLTNRGQEK